MYYNEFIIWKLCFYGLLGVDNKEFLIPIDDKIYEGGPVNFKQAGKTTLFLIKSPQKWYEFVLGNLYLFQNFTDYVFNL